MARCRYGRTTDRGYSESVQLAILLPLLMLVTLGVIQAGLWIHGHNVALRAAQLAVDEVSGTKGSQSRAVDMARGVARSGGLIQLDVSIRRSADEVGVTVSGDAPSMILGLGRISETAWAPVEQVTDP